MSDIKVLTHRSSFSLTSLFAETGGLCIFIWFIGRIFIPFFSIIKLRAMIASKFYYWSPSADYYKSLEKSDPCAGGCCGFCAKKKDKFTSFSNEKGSHMPVHNCFECSTLCNKLFFCCSS